MKQLSMCKMYVFNTIYPVSMSVTAKISHREDRRQTNRSRGDRSFRTNLRSTSISRTLVFLLQKKPFCSCTLYLMSWKLTVDPHDCLFWSTVATTFDLGTPLVPISSIIAMLMWPALSIIFCSKHPANDSDLQESVLLQVSYRLIWCKMTCHSPRKFKSSKQT